MHPRNSPDQLLTFKEAAMQLCISLRQFRRIVDEGRVAVIKISERTPRVRSSELERFLSSATVQRSHEVLT